MQTMLEGLVGALEEDYDPHSPNAVLEMDWVHFGFDCLIDVIEEAALNRKDCIEVLRNLVSNSKRDIEKLEAKLFVLHAQIELANTNKGDVIELCSKALREKINSLKLATCTLKNSNDHNYENGIALLQHKEAELPKEIHDTITTVLRNALYQKEQSDKKVIEDGLDSRETSIIHSTKNVMEHRLDAPETSVRHSSKNANEDRLDARETPVRRSNKNAKADGLDAPETPVRHSDGHIKKNVVEVGLDAPDKHANIQKSRVSACAKIFSASPKPPFMFDANKVKIEPQEPTSPLDNISLKSHSMLQSQRAKEMVKARANSTTCKVVPKELSLPGQRQRKHVIKQENICLTDHGNNGAPRSALMLQGQNDKNVAQVRQVEVQDRRTVAAEIGSKKVPIKVERRNGLNLGGEPLKANTGMLRDSELKATEMEKNLVKLEISMHDESYARVEVNGSNKGNAKRPNQMDPPDSCFVANNRQASASPITYKRNYKRSKKSVQSVLSNSSGAKEAGKFPTNGFCGDPVIGETFLSIVPYDAKKSMESIIANNGMPGELLGPDQLRGWTVAHLKNLIKARGITGYSKLRKEQLIQKLTEVEGTKCRLV